MATPAERAVIEAARALASSNPYNLMTNERTAMDLGEAVSVLDAIEHPADGPATLGVSYGQVVAGDLLQHRLTKAWHPVLENNVRDGSAHIRLKDVAKPIVKPAGEDVTVQRSEMGQAVDMFATVIWSGPNGEKT